MPQSITEETCDGEPSSAASDSMSIQQASKGGLLRDNYDESIANILVALAAERREERLGIDDFSAHGSDSEFAEEDPEELKRTSKPKRTIIQDDSLDSPELWAPFQRKTRVYYDVFEKKIVTTNPEEHVWTASRLWKSDDSWNEDSKSKGNVYGSATWYKGSTRTNNLVKLSLKVNMNHQSNNKRNMQTVIYFGEVLTYFCFEVDNKRSLLAAMKLYEANDTGEHGGWPYRTPSGRTKFIVTSIYAINDIVWYIESTGRHYFCWSGGGNKVPLGDLKDTF
ncbi:hypothetical protein BJV82DRAFT_584541 [Fennellomyces sp. T-0311]|nr:hypothetical protein BJV82DRAFT_584541 [Fennellomyces sp. T-0311]